MTVPLRLWVAFALLVVSGAGAVWALAVGYFAFGIPMAIACGINASYIILEVQRHG